MNEHERLLWKTSKIWVPKVSPDAPVRASNEYKFQKKVENRVELIENLLSASRAGNDGFVSAYSFPRGHPKDAEDEEHAVDRNIPEINTLFFDFDVPKDSEYRAGNHTIDAWKRSMSDLLVRVQMVADTLIDSGKAKHWRGSLSGHKGVHLFLDFQPVHPSNGNIPQFKNGLKSYGEGLIDYLDEKAGGINIKPWVDVDSSDLSRLVRHPNTPHPRAEHSEYQKWAVPVTIKELSEITPEQYLELTNGPRRLPGWPERNPSDKASRRIALEVRDAQGGALSDYQLNSTKDPQAVERYRKESNQKISVGNIPFLVQNKPCIMEYVKRDDAYAHGAESRVMEINVMKELIQKQVPIDVIVNFFRPIKGFNESMTRDLVEDLISRYKGPFVCQNIWDAGHEFCIGSDCQIYRNQYQTR